MLGWVRDAYAGDRTSEHKERFQKLKLVPTALSRGEVKLEPGSPISTIRKFRDYVAFLSSLRGQFLKVLGSGRPDREYSADEIKPLGDGMNELGDEITIMSGRSRERSRRGASEGKSLQARACEPHAPFSAPIVLTHC